MGRLAGYGLGLMFIAGYALLYSNLRSWSCWV